MSMHYPSPQGPGTGNNQGPPGQDLLGIMLAGAAAAFGTPYLFEFIGPFVERLTYDAYGSRGLADFMYALSFLLCGGIIYAAARIFFWYVLAAIVAYLATRAAGLAVI